MEHRRISTAAGSLGRALPQRGVVLLLVFAPLWIGCGPLGPFPGGRLSGEVGSPTQTNWTDVAEFETAQLETRPDDPHSVNTWFAAIEPALYVPTSMILGPKDPNERGWVAHVARDPRVRIRLGERVYERNAIRIGAAAEFDIARLALERKYGIAVDERDPERIVWIYRLDPAR